MRWMTKHRPTPPTNAIWQYLDIIKKERNTLSLNWTRNNDNELFTCRVPLTGSLLTGRVLRIYTVVCCCFVRRIFSNSPNKMAFYVSFDVTYENES